MNSKDAKSYPDYSWRLEESCVIYDSEQVITIDVRDSTQCEPNTRDKACYTGVYVARKAEKASALEGAQLVFLQDESEKMLDTYMTFTMTMYPMPVRYEERPCERQSKQCLVALTALSVKVSAEGLLAVPLYEEYIYAKVRATLGGRTLSTKSGYAFVEKFSSKDGQASDVSIDIQYTLYVPIRGAQLDSEALDISLTDYYDNILAQPGAPISLAAAGSQEWLPHSGSVELKAQSNGAPMTLFYYMQVIALA
eukprot:TRINITY_DN4863_c1_g1_i2.p1 TRINITY_DN4863_c1_g1~~TRINITY_DN4863_c1_g1_i2.p1  ORF type:complete len:252 (+),score=38.72 TRINITY_DN4863_c1_g1_i2:69-824(+)